MRPLLLAVLLTGCATLGASATQWSIFKYDNDWLEAIADPGVVNIACESNPYDSSSSYCGCAQFNSKVVWLSRLPYCAQHREETRQHEYAHILLGPSKAAVKMVHNLFPQRIR